MRRDRPVLRPIRLLAGVLAFAGLGGCYTFSGSGLPAGLRTVEIEQVQDRARRTELADEASRDILEAFRKNGALRPVDQDAQSRLEVTLAGYSHAPQQYKLDDGASVTRFRVTVSFDAKFVDLRDGSVLFEGSGISGWSDYDPDESTESEAAEKALAEAIKKLVDNTVSGW